MHKIKCEQKINVIATYKISIFQMQDFQGFFVELIQKIPKSAILSVFIVFKLSIN